MSYMITFQVRNLGSPTIENVTLEEILKNLTQENVEEVSMKIVK